MSLKLAPFPDISTLIIFLPFILQAKNLWVHLYSLFITPHIQSNSKLYCVSASKYSAITGTNIYASQFKPSSSLTWTSILGLTSHLEWNDLQIQRDQIPLYLFKVISYYSPISSLCFSYIVPYSILRTYWYLFLHQSPCISHFLCPDFLFPDVHITLARYHNPFHHYYLIHCTLVSFIIAHITT